MKITMPHSGEVTADRLDDFVRDHLNQISDKELAALALVVNTLRRIATEDRERMEAQS